MHSENYDIIIAGSGMAGLSLAYRALKEGVWGNERILIIDRDIKNTNDRTWCFWQHEHAESPFQEVIHHSWNELTFFSNEGRPIKLQNGKYAYHMIRSIDFYNHVFAFLRPCKQVTFISAQIVAIESTVNGGKVETSEGTYQAKYIFNSTYIKPELSPSNQYFLQHFKGITIRTTHFKGNPLEMYLMDFRTSQEHGTTFFYVLPLTGQEIFIEYTIFSKTLLKQSEYDFKIREYLSTVLKIADFEILEREFGVIPMTDYKFERRLGNVMHIGTSGGDTRASSGYTFTNTQKTISKILASFKKKGHPFSFKENINQKHKLLDATILKVLDNNAYPGHDIFTDLFEHVDGKTIFAFLDSESAVQEDLRIMRSLKATYFIRPFVDVLMQKLRKN